jgi:hypothetical protein
VSPQRGESGVFSCNENSRVGGFPPTILSKNHTKNEAGFKKNALKGRLYFYKKDISINK